MLDIAERLSPFNSHNDVVRIQLSCNHARQSLPLINAEIPFIRTGFEEEYLNYSSFLYIAKYDGKVIYKDELIMIVKYIDEKDKGEIISLGGPHGNKEEFDKILFTDLKENDEFKKDDILARHSTISKDGFLQLGCNLKTTYISDPYNFKDALIISESCAKKMSTRIIHEEIIDCVDSIPILWKDDNISYPQGTFINKAEKIFTLKPRNPKNLIDIISEGTDILAKASGILYYQIKIDEVIKAKNEADYYNNIYKKEIEREEIISKKIKEIYDIEDEKELLKCNASIGYYCPQLQKRRSGNGLILKYWIIEECPIIRGCKLTNRHGNKGVVAKILPDDKMPKDKYGEYCDIVVNSMCITSRMNVGQLFELHINRANYFYTSKILKDDSLSIEDKINKLYLMACDVQPEYINEVFKDFIDNSTLEEKESFINSIKKYNIMQLVIPPFTKFTYKDCLNFCKKYGKMDDSLKEELINNNESIDASFGYTYWLRLEHEPSKKIFSRSIGVYGKIGQPVRDMKNQKNAHRLGELETWALLSHQAYENILEFFVSKSDSISEAARLLKYLHDGISDKYTPFSQTPGILKVFENYIRAAGYDMIQVDEDEIENDTINNTSFLPLYNSTNNINNENKTITLEPDILANKIEDIFNLKEELSF